MNASQLLRLEIFNLGNHQTDRMAAAMYQAQHKANADWIDILDEDAKKLLIACRTIGDMGRVAIPGSNIIHMVAYLSKMLDATLNEFDLVPREQVPKE